MKCMILSVFGLIIFFVPTVNALDISFSDHIGQVSQVLYKILIDFDKVFNEDINLELTPIHQQYDASCGTAALAIALSGKLNVPEQEVTQWGCILIMRCTSRMESISGMIRKDV